MGRVPSPAEFDRHRLAEINGEITGEPYRPADPAWEVSKALYSAAAHDPDVLRAYTAVAVMLALPREALAAPGLVDKVMTLGAGGPRYLAPGPGRAELLDALVA